MLNFKKFNPDNFKTDVSGYLVPTKVLFINNSVVMLGELKENHISSSDYYISTDSEIFTVDNRTLVCEVNVEVKNEIEI